MVFVVKLCCQKKSRDPRIIRGKGTGASVMAGGSKKLMRISSQKSNHRHGMKVPQIRTFDESDESSDSD